MDTLRRGLSSRIIYDKVTAEVLLGSLCALILIGVSPAGLFAQPASFPDSSRKVEYRLEPLSGGLQQLEKMFNSTELMLLEKLNRCDLKHLARHSNIVVPLSWHSNELIYSPLPQTYAWAKQCPKALVVHQPSQCFGGYEYGHLVRWGPISSGRENRQTPAGFFHLNWRSIEWLAHGVELPENPTPGRHPCPAAAPNSSNQSDAVNPVRQEPDTR